MLKIFLVLVIILTFSNCESTDPVETHLETFPPPSVTGGNKIVDPKVDKPNEPELGEAPVEKTKKLSKFTIGKAVVEGEIDQAIVNRIARRHRSKVEFCIEKGKVMPTSAAASIQVNVSKEGIVENAKTKFNTLEDPLVAACLNTELKSWKFPKNGEGAVITVPFSFEFK